MDLFSKGESITTKDFNSPRVKLKEVASATNARAQLMAVTGTCGSAIGIGLTAGQHWRMQRSRRRAFVRRVGVTLAAHLWRHHRVRPRQMPSIQPIRLETVEPTTRLDAQRISRVLGRSCSQSLTQRIATQVGISHRSSKSLTLDHNVESGDD